MLKIILYKIRAFLLRKKAQGMVEYALILSVIALGLIAVLQLFRSQLANFFGSIVSTIATSLSQK